MYIASENTLKAIKGTKQVKSKRLNKCVKLFYIAL